MQKIAIALFGSALVCATAVGCAGTQHPKMSPKQEVQQLITLYTQAKPKFVLQKQKLIAAHSCHHAKVLDEVIHQMEDEANMQPGDTHVITEVRMELDQALKACEAK